MGKKVDPAKGKSEIEGRFTALAGVGRPPLELTVVRPTGGVERRVGGLVCLLKIKRSPRFPAIPPSRGSSWPLAMAARLAINKAEGSASAQRENKRRAYRALPHSAANPDSSLTLNIMHISRFPSILT